MKGLTKRQLEVAQFIENYIEENGYAPSVRNIADHFGFSPKAAFDHMTALKKKSIIKQSSALVDAYYSSYSSFHILLSANVRYRNRI